MNDYFKFLTKHNWIILEIFSTAANVWISVSSVVVFGWIKKCSPHSSSEPSFITSPLIVYSIRLLGVTVYREVSTWVSFESIAYPRCSTPSNFLEWLMIHSCQLSMTPVSCKTLGETWKAYSSDSLLQYDPYKILARTSPCALAEYNPSRVQFRLLITI